MPVRERFARNMSQNTLGPLKLDSARDLGYNSHMDNNIEELWGWLKKAGIPVKRQEPMSVHTTLRIGGPADLFVDADGESTCTTVIKACKALDIPVHVMGSGSNLLVSDQGIEGVVLSVGSGMAFCRREANRIIAGAGTALSQAAQFALHHGLTGLEALSGIPGTIGGCTAMNAGAYGREMTDVVESVRAMMPDGSIKVLDVKEMQFGYRTSAVMSLQAVVTEVTFLLAEEDPESIGSSMRDFAQRRRSKQPLNYPSAGSFFKRPEGHFAGALIEQAGLKGMREGGAAVSELHAGFIINTGGATAENVLTLVRKIRETVWKRSRVQLEPEVRFWGRGIEAENDRP